MRISEAARRSGLTIDTIRFYERSGLLPSVERGRDGRRVFSAENIDWLTLLASLRETGMPMEKMRHFADLYARGNPTIGERRALLQEHEALLDRRREALERCGALLKYKLAKYAEIEGA